MNHKTSSIMSVRGDSSDWKTYSQTVMSFLICYFNLLFLNIVFCLLRWCSNLKRNPKHQNVHLKVYDVLEYPATDTVKFFLFISLILAYLLCCGAILYMTFISAQYDLCLLFLFALCISNIHLRDGVRQYIMPSNSKEPGTGLFHCTFTAQLHPRRYILSTSNLFFLWSAFHFLNSFYKEYKCLKGVNDWQIV